MRKNYLAFRISVRLCSRKFAAHYERRDVTIRARDKLRIACGLLARTNKRLARHIQILKVTIFEKQMLKIKCFDINTSFTAIPPKFSLNY